MNLDLRRAHDVTNRREGEDADDPSIGTGRLLGGLLRDRHSDAVVANIGSASAAISGSARSSRGDGVERGVIVANDLDKI